MAYQTTWLERLCMNLLSYSIVLLPIALVVIATRHRLFPSSILSSSLVQWFVHGSSQIDESRNRRDDLKCDTQIDDDKKLLLSEESKAGKLNGSGKIDMTSRSIDFIWCLVGLQLSYLVWGLLQEKIMTTKYPTNATSQQKNLTMNHFSPTDLNRTIPGQSSANSTSVTYITFHDSQFLVFINRLVAFVTAIIALVYSRRRQTKQYADRFSSQNYQNLVQDYRQPDNKSPAPLYKYIYCSLSNIMSSWCQYEALKYVNFPTQCLSKSCKVIPVMLMSKILLRKRYSTIDYLCALLLAFGMFVFMFNQPTAHHAMRSITSHNDNDKSVMRNSLISGLIILVLYLTFDSFTSNWQQSLYSRYNVSNWQMMAAINFYSILLTLTSLHQLGGLEPAFRLLASSSLLLRDCMIMSIMSSVGQMFVYYTIKRFGSVLFAVIMTLRQFVSILLSCTIFGHRMNLESGSGLILVFLVVGFQVWHKSSPDKNKKRPTNSGAGSHSTTMGTASDKICIRFKPLVK